MKFKKFIGAALALLAVGAVNATVYLTKNGQVVAQFEDSEVDAITFDDPVTYDVSCSECEFMTMTYYGDAFADRGYNYSILLSEEGPNDKGSLPVDKWIYQLRFVAPYPDTSNGAVPLLPAGTYKMGKSGVWEEWTVCANDMSYARCGATINHLTDATFTIAYTDEEMIVCLKAKDQNGQTYKAEYVGVAPLDDQSITWQQNDIHIDGGVVNATFLKPVTGGYDKKCNINISIASKGFDGDGWLVTPCDLMTFVGNVSIDDNGQFVPGTWTIIDSDVAQPNTLCAGQVVNLMGVAFPADTNVKHYTSKNRADVGLVKSGTATITSTGINTYVLEYDFTSANGKKITGHYEGKISIKDLPAKENWHFESDYVMDLNGAIPTCMDFNPEVKLDLHYFNNNYAYTKDRLEVLFIPDFAFGPGIYKVKPDANCAGSIKTGQFRPGFATGSVFRRYDERGEVFNGTGITDGQVEVIDNGNGTWTFNFDLVDDTPAKHKITGTWTGAITII